MIQTSMITYIRIKVMKRQTVDLNPEVHHVSMYDLKVQIQSSLIC